MDKKRIVIKTKSSAPADVTLVFDEDFGSFSPVFLSESEARQLHAALSEVFDVKEPIKPVVGLKFIRPTDYYVFEICVVHNGYCMVKWYEIGKEQNATYAIKEATEYLNDGSWNKIN